MLKLKIDIIDVVSIVQFCGQKGYWFDFVLFYVDFYSLLPIFVFYNRKMLKTQIDVEYIRDIIVVEPLDEPIRTTHE